MAAAESYYLKATDVAKRLRVDKSHVYRLIESGELPSVRIGERTVRVPAGGLEAYLEARSQGGPVEPKREEITRIPQDRGELLDAAHQFEDRTGHDPYEFVAQWRQGQISDTAENADIAIEAITLRAALIEADAIRETA
jgi:excisionase family DNA binding protein